MTLDLSDPIAVLLGTSKALATAGIEHATYGGLALAVYGEPRETRDADLAVAGADVFAATDALSTASIRVVTTFERVPMGGHAVTRLTLLDGNKLNTVDLVEPRSARYAALVLGRKLEGTLRGQLIAVLEPEDFVVFKLLSTRHRDIEDARTVMSSLGQRLDRERIEFDVTELASEIPDHDISARWAEIGGRS